DLESSVNAVSAATTVLNLIDLSRFNGFLARLDHTRKVIWMNCADERPVLQFFTCSTEILKGLSVEKLYLSHCPRRGHEPGNVVNDLPPREFSRAQGFLAPLAVLDVYKGSVPFEDVARFIPQWIGTNQEPSI